MFPGARLRVIEFSLSFFRLMAPPTFNCESHNLSSFSSNFYREGKNQVGVDYLNLVKTRNKRDKSPGFGHRT